jgi:hypothetical protein
MTDYYVDATGGDDSNAGTSTGAAWQTISKVNGVSFSAGDNIYFKRGEQWREELTVPSSGDSSDDITFGAYGTGAKPIINGADLVSTWTSTGTENQWEATCTTEPYVVYIDGNFGDKKADTGSLADEYDWYWASNTLYVYSTSDPDTAYTSPGIEAGARGVAIDANEKDYITVENLHLRQGNVLSGETDYGSGVYLDGENWHFDTLTIDRNYYAGILCTTGSASGEMQGCTITDNGETGIHMFSGAGSTWTIDSNTIYDNGWRDIWGSGIITKAESVVIKNNTLYNNGYAGAFGYDHGIYIDQADLTTPVEIYGNTIYGHIKGHGVQTKSSANIYQNHIYDNYDGGVYVGENGSNDIEVNVYYNLLHDNKYGVVEMGKGAGGITLNIYNNTTYHNDDTNEAGTPAEISIEDDVSLTIKNNIIYTTDSTYAYSMVSQTGMTSDYNCVYRAGSGNFIYYNGSSRTWSYWQNTAGFDGNGMNSDPSMTDPGNDDFTLQVGSPCIDAGTDVGLTEDYAGNSVGASPDIGAYEKLLALFGGFFLTMDMNL